MIQRIQSIYLLLAAILMAVTAFSPLLVLANTEEATLTFCSLGIGTTDPLSFPTWGVISMAGIGSLLSLIAVFMFKNRKRQVKLVQLAVVFVIIFYVTTMVYLASYLGSLSAEAIQSAQYGIILPVIALILQVLAIGKIKKDEKLVRSLDRIR